MREQPGSPDRAGSGEQRVEPSAKNADRGPEPVSLPSIRGGTSHLGAAGSSVEERQLPTKRSSTAAQRPHGEGRMARKPRQARTLPHARVGGPGSAPIPEMPEESQHLPLPRAASNPLLTRLAAAPLAPAVLSWWPLTNPLPALSACGVPSSALRCRH